MWWWLVGIGVPVLAGGQGATTVLFAVLDRLDYVAFAAPIFFHLTRYWFTP